MSLIKRVNLERKFRFILLILFVTLSNFSLIRITKLTFITEKIGFIQPGMLDFLVNLCKGTTEVKISKDTFYIPVDPGFMGIQFLVLLLVSDISSLKLRGNEHVFLKFKNRYEWWISRCISIIVTVVLSYFLIVLECLLFGLISGGGLGVHDAFSTYSLGVRTWNMHGEELFFITVVFQIVFAVSICLFQNMLSLITGPVLSVAAVMAMEISSVFIKNKWLFGNYQMLLRLNKFVGSRVSLSFGLILAVVLAVSSVFFGCVCVRKRDIY